MKERLFISFFLALGFFVSSFAQFTAEEIAERGKWEKFLEEADIVDFYQMKGREAVTEPWVLTLEKDGVRKQALWKNAKGRKRGYLENWHWEIAAYRIDKLIGLEMVPPTVEKRFREERGSCQLWIDDTMTLRDKVEKKIKTPPVRVFYWNRALYKQRTWDNLIANDDRHQNQFLITDDFRILLCDHSRSFRTTKKLTRQLIYDENHREGPRLMREIPCALYKNIKSLTFDKIKDAVGDHLKTNEIEAVLKRKDLIINWIENRIGAVGGEKVLY